jgi:DNA polymerase III delta subunit
MIVTLTGENSVQRSTVLRELIDAFISQHGDMALERLDGEEADYERMHAAVQSLPFLAVRKLVVLRSPSANKEFIEKFEQFTDDIAETNDVVLVEPKLDKRLSYYKLLKRDTQFRDFPVLDSNGLARYISIYAKEQGGTISPTDARLLIDRTGQNQLALQHEVTKLIAYTPTITRESIELLTERTPQSSIFELLDTAFSGNATHAMALYEEQRALRVEPQQIIAMIIWQLHVLAVVKAAGSRTPDEIAKQSKISPFTVRKTQSLARHTSLSTLKELISSLRTFDIRLKSEGLNADEVTRYYLLHLAKK